MFNVEPAVVPSSLLSKLNPVSVIACWRTLLPDREIVSVRLINSSAGE